MRRQTQVWYVDPVQPADASLLPAVEVLRRGGVVAFPTETVYGLGADALNPDAVARIFEAKGRPQDNPLIVHVASLDMAFGLMGDAGQRPIVERLAAAFWPGPLTLVVTRNARISDRVTAGLDTVGLRMPAHPVALRLIQLLGRPIAAPSANRSGRPSPTLAEHVLADLDGRIDGVVAGGVSSVGVESTVLDVTVSPPVLYRPGGVTPEALEAVLGGPVVIDPHVRAAKAVADAGPVRSPGMKYRHYAPSTPIVLVECPQAAPERIRQVAEELAASYGRVGLLLTDETAEYGFAFPVVRMGPRHRPERIAAGLFAALRQVDGMGFDVVVAEGIADRGVGLAVMNRLRRAASQRIE